MLMRRQLADITLARFAFGWIGGVLMPALLFAQGSTHSPDPSLSFVVLVVALVTATIAGELLERYLFFAAVAAPRMPGAMK